MEFRLNDSRTPDGTILLFDLRYLSGGSGTTYTYVLSKAAGQWYTSGGKGPQAAGWGAVQRWLADPGREVVRVRVVTEIVDVWPTRDRASAQATPEPVTETEPLNPDPR